MIPQFPGRTHIYYGPPGTGKTFRLLKDLDSLLKRGYKPNEILLTSFTREGTNVGARRACSLFNYTRKDVPYMRTWHSLAFHALGLQKDRVITPGHFKMFGDSIGMNFMGHWMGDMQTPDDKYLFFVDLLRNNSRLAFEYLANVDYKLAQYVASSYRTFKDTFELLDFTDMITQYVRDGAPLPVRAAILDEAQDYSTLHWQMAEIALSNCEEIYIAGDDDQAIYQWSGADVATFMSLEGEKEVLGASHRLPRAVLNFSKSITQQILTRIPKEYSAKDADGHVSFHADFDEVPLDLPGTYMFLVRNNKYISMVTEFLEDRGVLYTTKEGDSVPLGDMESIVLWGQHCAGKELTHSQEMRVQQLVGDATIYKEAKQPWNEAFHTWDLRKIEYIGRVIQRYGMDIREKCVTRVSTIHMVKGAEADNVVLFMGMSRLTWLDYQEDQDAEHRVFYVGATRASERLYVVLGDEKYSYDINYQLEAVV